MQTLSFKAVPRRRAFSLLASAFVLFALSAPARAQVGAIDDDPAQAIGTRLTARNAIQGTIVLPSGHRYEKRVKVRITGPMGQSLITWTDDSGNFVFRRLAGGNYLLTVEAGEEFQTANESVDIFARGGASVTQPVYIQLHYKKMSGEKPGTVDAALAGAPKEAVKHYEKALKAASEGEPGKAVESLERALKVYSDFAPALNQLGLQYLKLNQPDKAADALQRALKLAPEEFGPNLNYGIVLFYQKRFADAERHLRLALTKRESSAAAHFYLGRTLIKSGSYADAEKELVKALELGGDGIDEAHRFLGGIYREMGDNARAVASLEKYLSVEPKAKDADAIRAIIAEMRAQEAPRKPE